MENENLENFWNTCSLSFSHIDLTGRLKGYDHIIKMWYNEFSKHIDFNNKTVLDYGIGASYFGKYLFDNHSIKYYYGIDISQRSLVNADKILTPYKNYKLYYTEDFYNNFSKDIDIIVSQACIQHFPDIEYLVKFLKKLNTLNASTIMLQITHNKPTICKPHDYTNMKEISRSCFTHKDFLLKYLTNYVVSFTGPIRKNSYQFLIFTKKSE